MAAIGRSGRGAGKSPVFRLHISTPNVCRRNGLRPDGACGSDWLKGRTPWKTYSLAPRATGEAPAGTRSGARHGRPDDRPRRLVVLAQGTGQALQTATRDDADLVLVHNPEAEQKFIAAGDGIDRRQIAWNDFMVVGPRSDPAHIAGSRDAVAALKASAAARAVCLARRQERHRCARNRLWLVTGIDPAKAGGFALASGSASAAFWDFRCARSVRRCCRSLRRPISRALDAMVAGPPHQPSSRVGW